MPCVSVTEETVSPGTKSNATKMTSPGRVLAENDTARELALDEAALAATCTNATPGEEAVPMVRLRVAVPVPVELVALRVTFDVPEAVGVPEIRPVEVLMVRFAGSPAALKLVGELDAVIW